MTATERRRHRLAVVVLASTLCGGGAAAQDGLYPGPYFCEVLRVINGDTFEANLGIWPTIRAEVSVRLAGYDAPEIRRPACEAERHHGHLAARALAEALPEGAAIRLENVRADAFSGRVVADVLRLRDRHASPVAVLVGGTGLLRAWNPGERAVDWCRIFSRGGR